MPNNMPDQKQKDRYLSAIETYGLDSSLKIVLNGDAEQVKKFWLKVPRFKRVVFIRDHFTCKHCGYEPLVTNEDGILVPDLKELECDHIIPIRKGGKTILDNLQTLCKRCNRKKGSSWIG